MEEDDDEKESIAGFFVDGRFYYSLCEQRSYLAHERNRQDDAAWKSLKKIQNVPLYLVI